VNCMHLHVLELCMHMHILKAYICMHARIQNLGMLLHVPAHLKAERASASLLLVSRVSIPWSVLGAECFSECTSRADHFLACFER
jgi:hypothetical protein